MPRAKRGVAAYLPLKRRLRSAMTAAEACLWSRLRLKQVNGLKFRRQHGIGPYIVDFYCPERGLVIEVDGDSHGEMGQQQKDEARNAYLRSLGLLVLRYTNTEVIENLEGVLQDLTGKVATLSTSPPPSLQRRG